MCRLAVVVLLAIAAIVACGPRDVPNRLIAVAVDGGGDASFDAAMPKVDAQAEAASPYLGGPCVDDGQCNDQIACTYDSCDTALGRCLNVPDDTQCDDGIYCNGQEKCIVGHGCEPGDVVSCNDNNPCHIAHCVEATKSCTYALRDVDGDGDPDEHCSGGHDCDDMNPNVSSLHAEVCNNGIDDNCNGKIDEAPCVNPQGDTCATAIAVGGAGTTMLSTRGNTASYATSCSVTAPLASQQVVAAITVPAGPKVDLDVWATSQNGEIAVALDATCGQASSELGCGSGTGATSVRARAYAVSPGTYYAIVTTQQAGAFTLQVRLLPPSAPAPNVDCGTAIAIQPSTPTAVSLVDPPALLATSCAPMVGSATGELTYSVNLAQPQDVRVFASTVQGSGTPIIGLRDPACSGQNDELDCRLPQALPVYRRALPPGIYYVTVSATSPIDASVQVVLSPPSPTPVDQLCASPPPILANGRVSFNLANHENDVLDQCASTLSDAVYDLSLPAASDVLLIERLGLTDFGGLSLDPSDCGMYLGCTVAPTPIRLGRRNVQPGDYRVVVSDQLSLDGTVDALVRPTVAPTNLMAGAADNCMSPKDISAGGFFTGDTSKAMADYTNPCDTPAEPPGGANDQVLSMNLAAPQRVVFDMEGSGYTTILDVRQGATCPGTPLTNACYVGFNAQKSFLDMELAAGQYWIIIDGYAGSSGPWNLDVRVLPP